MSGPYIITVDIGTSSAKTVLWSLDGVAVAQASEAYPLQRPHPVWAEIDAELWWRATCRTVRQVIAESGVDSAAIVGVGVDAVGWTLVPVDAAGDPLRPAIIWLDRRADVEAERLRALPGSDQLVELDANPLDPAYITPKLIWLLGHEPDVVRKTRTYLGSTGFLVSRLTGALTCDYTQAYGYHFFDMRQECWSAEAADRIGVALDKMPPLRACTEVVGGVTAAAAEATGLRAGTPVIVGCLDAAVGALGSGVTRLGQTNEQGGQAGGMAVSVDRVIVEPRLIFSHHVLSGQYLLQGGTVGGGSLGWFRDVLGQVEANAAQWTGADAFELLSAEAHRAPAGSHGLLFLPYMAGERTPLWNTQARGAFVGLTYSSTRQDLVRAIMEGCAFAVRDNVEVAAESGVVIDEYLGSGGATRSPVWCQIKADVYGKPFVLARRPDGGEGGHALGLLALTAQGVGLVDDAGAMVEQLLPNRRVFEPNREHVERYAELFAIYRRVSRSLLAETAALASLG